MYRTLTVITLFLLTTISGVSAASLRVDGGAYPAITDSPAASTGLQNIYIVHDLDGVSLTYTASSASATVTWQSYGVRGASYPEEVNPADISQSGAEHSLTAPKGDTGYIITENGKPYYFWLTDYSAHPFTITALHEAPDQDCDRAFIATEGSAERIIYYGINGRSYTLDRDITVSYTTLVPDIDNFRYTSAEEHRSLEYISDNTFNVPAPLCDTYFHMAGDRFLRTWGMEQQITSSLFTTRSVAAESKAMQTTRDSENEIRSDGDLGGSAPAEITFSAIVSDAAVFTEWQFATDPEFIDIVTRFNELETVHTFRDMGTTYVRFVAADASGTCEYYSDTYTVNIGQSRLQCPNAFSPGASEGVNDEWKVSYQSIVSFECYIFNRWGKKMAEFHDPSQGWDGKQGGKLVPAGVYYYVIKAKGSDGKQYNLSGDINIVRSKRR